MVWISRWVPNRNRDSKPMISRVPEKPIFVSSISDITTIRTDSIMVVSIIAGSWKHEAKPIVRVLISKVVCVVQNTVIEIRAVICLANGIAIDEPASHKTVYFNKMKELSGLDSMV